jgi:hypothetical protein
MRTFITAHLNKKVGDVTDAARCEPVLLTTIASRASS